MLAIHALGRLTILWLFGALLTGCVTTGDLDREAVEGADQYAADGLLKEAISRYRSVLNQNPHNPWAKRNLGMTYLRAKDYANAIINLESVSEPFAHDPDLNYSLAEAYRASEKYPEAIFRYQKSLDLMPREGRALKGVAWSYYKLRYYPEALASVRQFKPRADSGDDGQAAVIESRILARMDRFEDALRVIRLGKQGLEQKAGLAYLLSVEGEVLAARGDCVAANKVFRDALKRQPLLAGSLLGIGKCFVKDNKPELAIEYLERAVRIRPSLTEGYYLLSEALGPPDKARATKYLKKFRQLAANDPEWVDQIKSMSLKSDGLDPQDSKSRR